MKEIHDYPGKVDGLNNKQGELMETQIEAVFCLVDDILKVMCHRELEQCKMSDTEVLTTAINAALYFSGNYTHARELFASQAVQ